jgi:hypothetical protein
VFRTFVTVRLPTLSGGGKPSACFHGAFARAVDADDWRELIGKSVGSDGWLAGAVDQHAERPGHLVAGGSIANRTQFCE